MKTIIAGSRQCTDSDHLLVALDKCGWIPSVVISGNARGVDRLGELWAEENKVPCIRYPANWEKYGSMAGPIRNEKMAEEADALIAIWDGKSKGTKHMIGAAKRRGLKVYIHMIG
jgi:hypothetical protein